MNLGFLGKGNCSDEAPLIEQVKAGAMGLKIHEDWGATPAVINHCLNVADEYDVQVAIHTDTLNEGGCVEDTLAAIGGRTIHTYHTEGAGGGHAPDIIRHIQTVIDNCRCCTPVLMDLQSHSSGLDLLNERSFVRCV